MISIMPNLSFYRFAEKFTFSKQKRIFMFSKSPNEEARKWAKFSKIAAIIVTIISILSVVGVILVYIILFALIISVDGEPIE